MAPIKIERIVSVSTEDEAHPATNLLRADWTNKKWKCKTPGEKQISVVFQLAQFGRIISIDVGNEHSAFIEVLVGKSSASNDDFNVLLVSSSLMTLQESKNSSNINGVTFFKEESLCKPTSDEKWDRVKVVCTQPFNKYVQFGLSFILFHSNDSQSNNILSLPTKAATKNDPILSAGGLFANRCKLSPPSSLTGAAAIRAAHGKVKINLKRPSTDEGDSTNVTSIPGPSSDEAGKKLPNGSNEDKTKTSKDDDRRKKKNGETSGRSKDKSPPKKRVARASVEVFNKRAERPFRNLMTGVLFAMSGFVNPLRSDLRNKALAMGARYQADWNPSCTHLICAFRNTPKYHQVRGRGKIVKSAWIVESYSRRKRLPWRRFALDPNDAAQAESEEEIFEEVPTPSAVVTSADRNPIHDDDAEDGDTDDEIERVILRQNQLNTKGTNGTDNPSTSGRPGSGGTSATSTTALASSTSSLQNNFNSRALSSRDDARSCVNSSANKDDSLACNKNHKNENKTNNTEKETDVYDMDTDSEDDSYWVKKTPEENSLPPLPTFFGGATIALLDDLSTADKKLLTRYIKAHKGSIADDSTDLDTILYVITEDPASIERVREDFPQVIGVLPEWIWRSHDEAKLLPASSFQVT